jgi:outer membrane protein assembly factor BamB
VHRLTLKWKFDTLDGWPVQNTPAVIGDTLFFGAGAYFYSLDSATGKLNWKFESGLGGPWLNSYAHRGIRSSCEYKDGRIYMAASGLCTVHCLDASTGKEIWKTNLESRKGMAAQMWYSVAVHNGKVFAGYAGAQGAMFCLDGETGAIRWRYRAVPDVPEELMAGGGSLWTSAAVDEQQNVVFNVTGNLQGVVPGPNLYAESILAHDADTGELLWAYQAHPQGSHDHDFCAPPMIFDAVAPQRMRGDIRRCVAAGNKADFLCFNRHTGELYWKAAFWPSSSGGVLYHSTGVANNTVYVQAGSLGVNLTGALHAYTGEIQWLVPNSGPHQGPLALANGLLFQGGSNPHKIEALDAKTGKQLWQFPLPSIYRGGITVANGAVYTGNGGGNRWEGQPGPFSIHCLTIDGV